MPDIQILMCQMRDAGYPDLGQPKSCSRIIRSFDCWRQVYQLMLDSSGMEGVKQIHYTHRYNSEYLLDDIRCIY
jgi:hypothetical protein